MIQLDVYLALLGMVAGLFGRITCVGVGAFVTPLLTLYLGLPIQSAIAISLVAITAAAIAGTIAEVRSGVVDVRLGGKLELAAVLGALPAALFAGGMARHALLLLFTVALFFAVVVAGRRLWQERRQAAERATPAQGGGQLVSLIAALFAGTVVGCLSVGGEAALIPVLRSRLGLAPRTAAATSNFALALPAAAAAWVFYLRGDVFSDVAAPLAIGAFAGGFLGARWGQRVRPVVAVALLVAAMSWLLAQLLRKLVGGA